MTYRRSVRALLGTSLVLLGVFATAANVGGCNSRQDGAPVVSTAAAAPAVTHYDAVPTPAPALTPAVERPFPIPVVELRGTADQIGRAHGEALGSNIRELHDRYFAAYFKNQAAKFLALTTAGLFEPRLSPDHRDEVKALAAGCAVDPKQMLLAQCFLDLSPMVACSTVTLPAAASPDGVARFGRNLDFPSFNIADKRSVVLVYHPAGRHAFAAVAWPGMAGVLTGMNEHGLTLANMEVTRSIRMPSAMPYTLLYRSVLERCSTVAEAVEFLEETPRQSANNLMLMDAAGDRAVVELTPDGVTVRRAPKDAALISTNHQRGADDLDTSGECRRYDRLHATAARDFGTIDEPAVERMLAGVAQGKNTMQSMVFEPAGRVMYLSTGKHAAEKEFHRLDLGKLFARGESGASVARAE